MSSSNVSIDSVGNLISADRVGSLAPGEIFVFGSNARGKHGSGAARDALDRFGAIYGQGHGLQGSSYAIDTMSGTKVLAAEIASFLAYAAAHREQTFLVTRIGCGIAGFTPAEIAPHFAGCPRNVALPQAFLDAGAGNRTPASSTPTASGGTRPTDRASELVRLLKEGGLTIATAESLTGGLLAAELVSVSGASLVFNGGIVSYHTELTYALLGVDPELLAVAGPVDPLVAQQMAEGVRSECAVGGRPADFGLATTGVAGPDPDPQTGKPAGIVYLGIATVEGARSVALSLAGDRASIRAATVVAALHEALVEMRSIAPGLIPNAGVEAAAPERPRRAWVTDHVAAAPTPEAFEEKLATGESAQGDEESDEESDRCSGCAAVRRWLAGIGPGATVRPDAFLPIGSARLIEAIWRPDDLGWTEELIRTSMDQDHYSANHPTGLADLNALLARVLLARSCYEDALEALASIPAAWGPVQANLPYWWVQLRGLAQARLAVQSGNQREALSSLLAVVCDPSPGRYADPDYLLQGLRELALLDVSGVPEAPDPRAWVHLALAAEEGLQRWSQARGWDPAKGYDDDARAQFEAILAGRRVRWESRDPSLPPNRSRLEWEGELDTLEEMLDELVATYLDNNFVWPRPFIAEMAQLWNPLDPSTSRLLATDLLAQNRSASGMSGSAAAPWGERPWHLDKMAAPQLQALLVRALALEGNIDDARGALEGGLPQPDQPPGWISQLEALTNGRVAKAAGATETAFDQFWLAVRLWQGEPATDVDLLLETLCELATLGDVSPLHPQPADWARIVHTMAHQRPDDEWQPGSWYDRELAAQIDAIRL